jgi:hypothetical protein
MAQKKLFMDTASAAHEQTFHAEAAVTECSDG